MPAPSNDPTCQARGIPNHLHQIGRPIDNDFEPAELLYRRYPFGAETLKQIIVFKRMSVNREKHGHGADDALWNCEEGGRFKNCGVAGIPAGVFERRWPHPEYPDTFYYLRPGHAPLQCNYPHAEVVVYKEQNGIVILQDKIKPESVKVKIREELQKYPTVALPVERRGETFPVS